MTLFNRITTLAFDAVFGLLERLNPWAGLIVVSVISGALLLLIFKGTSNQKALKSIKKKISGGFLEIRIYKDEPVLMIKALLNVFAADFAYLRHTIVPLIFMVVPVMLFLIHADMRYGSRPARPGETIVVSVFADTKDMDGLKKIDMLLPAGMNETVPPVRIPESGEIDFAVKAGRNGDYKFKIVSGDTEIEQVFICGTGVGRAAHSRVRGNAWTRLFNPAYPPLPPGVYIKEVRIEYPERIFSIAGFHVNWMPIYFVISIVFGYSIKGLLKVEI